ncbi:hypothetical protein Gorai_010083, partial [Gossypium raimondii]|nr:hypothetical protein [Gossypium raimondii]
MLSINVSGQHFTKYTRRKHRKVSSRFPTWFRSSVRCFGFTMHCLRKMPFSSLPSTLSAFSFKLFTLLLTFTTAQRKK